MDGQCNGHGLGAAAPAAPNGGPCDDTVYLTRDCVHWRVIRSPLAGIARSLFTLLAGDSELSSAARRCYASAILDHPESNSPYSPSLDAQIREFFTSPPHLACIQGAFKVDLIHREEPAAPSTPKSVTPSINSSMTALSGPTSLLDVVFVNFTMHNELNRCAREDEEQHARLAWFALSTLVHESAHWLYTKVNGYKLDEQRVQAVPVQAKSFCTTSFSSAGHARADPLIAIGQRPEDCGARAVDLLLGGTAIMVSFADGDTEVVKRKIEGISTAPPTLSQSAVDSLLGVKMPPVKDITGAGPVIIGGAAPAWSTHEPYLVTSKTAANSFCPHGHVRIGSLF